MLKNSCTSSIILRPTYKKDLLVFNKLEEAEIFEGNEVIKVNIELLLNTIVDKVERNIK